MESSICAVERILNYSFKDKRLVQEALTHSSFSDHYPTVNYERLEFVGDAALGLAVINHVFFAYPDLDQGQLSLLRDANISTEKLARVAIKHDLRRFLRHNVASLDRTIEAFAKAVSVEDDAVAYGGEVKAPKVLADIVESLAAAVYIDVNFDLQRLWVIIRNLLEPIVTPEDLQQQPQPVTMLFELCQKLGKEVNIVPSKNGTKNMASVYVDGHFVACGSSEHKDIAKLNAVKGALKKLAHVMPPSIGHFEDVLDIDGPFNIEGAKQKLHEICGKKKWSKPIYKIEKENGPAHEKKFICSVQVGTAGGVLCMQGDEQIRVKHAESSAAALLIRTLQELKCDSSILK